MNDKELLEKAAKAAGHKVTEERGGGLPWTIRKEDGKLYPWNPLVDDGDALRLASKVGMNINFWECEVVGSLGEYAFKRGDAESLRRAMVSAAAIGETME